MSSLYKYSLSILLRTRLFVMFFILFNVSSLSIANTVKWTILPEYDYLEPYCEGIYKYVDHATIGLVEESGNVIEGSQCDSIMPPNADGLALLLQNPGNSEATLVGIFNCKKRKVILVDNDFKVNMDFAFFNDDRLPICDSEGNWGYLGIDGQIAIPCQYKQAGPFSLQLAPVRLNNENKNVVYIKSDGTRITVDVNKGTNKGIIGDGTPFFMDSTADVHFNGKYWRITRNGKKKNNIAKSEYHRSIDDWLSEYRQSMQKNTVVSTLDRTLMQTFLDSPEGQIINGQVSVFSTIGDQAIVGYKGKMGLLQRVQGDFYMGMAADQVTVKDKKVEPQVLKVDVSVPDAIDPLELSFFINNYRTEPTPKGNGSQELRFETSRYADVTSSITEVINVDIRDHLGLHLFTGESKVNITYIKPDPPKSDPGPIPLVRTKCVTCGADKSKCPHNGVHPICPVCDKVIDIGHRVKKKNRCERDGNHPTPPSPI